MVCKNITLSKSSLLPTLSVAMIVKNEEKFLPELLNTLQGVVDEIIIVDTGSTDNTKQIAINSGAKVFDFPWNNNFSDARNESLKYCTKDYIIWLDADDRIKKQDFAMIKAGIQKNPGAAYFLCLLDTRHDKEFTSYQLRVVPNHRGIQFIGRVHEQMSFSVEREGIPYVTLPITIFHIGYNSPLGIQEKLQRNLNLLLEEAKDDPENFLVNLNLSKSLIGLQRVDESDTYINKCLDLIFTNKVPLDKENIYIAVLTKLSIFAIRNEFHNGLLLLKRVNHLFKDMDVYKLTYGEACFKNLDYREAYKNLFFVLTGRINLGLVPLDIHSIMKSMINLLLYSALAVGDKETVEGCIQRIINLPTFRISEDL